MLLHRSLVFASLAAAVLAPPTLAAPASRDGLVLVAAQPDAIAAAEQAVSDARAALRHAMASGKGLKEARAGLTAALKLLDQAEAGGAKPSAAAVPVQRATKPPAEPATPAASATKPEATEARPETSPGAAGQPAGTPPVAEVPAAATPLAVGERLADGRVILRENGRLVVSHDEDARLAASGGHISEEAAGNGERFITVDLPDGSQVVTVRDGDGNIVRRTLKLHKGDGAVLIDANPANAEELAASVGDLKHVVPVAPKGPGQFVVDGGRATPEAIGAALAAPPIQAIDRSHTLAEIRGDARLRVKLRSVDIDTIGFDEGRATLPEAEAAKLAGIGHALTAILAARPDEIFLIEGHTDAVGSDIGNLVLTDRRAETVAEVLTQTFGVPAENLVTQGYGDQYLKVPTEAAEPRNRRITIRRITPLLQIGNGV
jgi:outer membrane protein OmpA-like peptidoglycan-associated protein